MGEQAVNSLGYMLQKLDEGFTVDFIVRDSGIKRDSVMRRFDRAKKKGLLNKRQIFLIWGNKSE